ncbi:MAG: oligosaccharide flippase family protein, partial [Pseudomonadota bacterium]|nr:oligosaccharide flippase family protein [Pseudomonadota bacterium]
MFSQLKKIDKEFFIKSSASFVIRIFSQAMALAIAVLLTRLLSVEGFGLYSITIATVMIAAIFVKDAAHLLWTRFAANYVAEENWGALKGALIAAFTYATLLGVGLIIILYMLRNTLVLAAGHFATAGFLISLWLIPIVGITFAFMGVLKGMKHVIWAQLPEFALRPFLLCLMLLVFFMWGPQT